MRCAAARSAWRLAGAHAAALVLAGCAACGAPDGSGTPADEAAARERMVAEQIEARGVRDAGVLAAMRRVPRHEFVPSGRRGQAYQDRPLPIGFDQTISQPYVVAVMTEAAEVASGERVLEVGTGSGYQAAVLAELGAEVYSIEIVGPLAERAAETLRRLGYARIQVRHGDGWAGWPEAAPFDAIVVTAAPPEVPPALLAQLAEGGRLVIPVGGAYQQLEVHVKEPDRVRVERLFPVRFVPMTGGEEEPP